MPYRVLAVDAGPAAVKAAVVESAFRGYRVSGLYHAPRSPETSAADAVRRLVQDERLHGDVVISGLAGDLVAHRILTMPFRDARRLAQTVPLELETQVPFDLAEVVGDHQVLERVEKGAVVLAALARRAEVQEYVGQLAEAGLEPARLHLAPLAELNVLRLARGLRDADLVFLDVGYTTTTVACLRAGHLTGMRTLSTGTRDAGPDPLLKGIRWTLLALGASGAAGPGRAVVAGDGVSAPLIDRLRGDLGLEAVPLDGIVLEHVPDSLRHRQGSCAAALGMALAEVAEGPTLALNFRQGDLAFRGVRREARRTAMRLGALAACAVVLMLADYAVGYRRLQGRFEELRQQARAIFLSAVPDARTVVSERAQLADAVKNLERRREMLAGVAPTGSEPLDVLYEMTRSVPRDLPLDIEDLSIDGEAARLRGKLETFEAVESLKRSLAQSRLWHRVDLKESKTAADGRIEFRLDLLLGPGSE